MKMSQKKAKKTTTKPKVAKKKVVSKKSVKKTAKKRAAKKVSTKTVDTKVEKKTPAKKAVKKKTRRRKAKGKMYFTQETEDAIVLYNLTEDEDERNRIYREKISQPIKKLAENIFNTFKFSYYDTNPQDVQQQVVSELTSKLDKYKSQENGGGKAFSYFSIVAKNWLILYNNNMFKKWKQHTEILDAPDEETQGQILITEKDNTEEIKEFNSLMVDYWDENISRVFTKKKELDIANAIIELFRNSHRLENFNKKSLYLYIREISGCKTQNITKVINKMKSTQRDIQDEYVNAGVVTTHTPDERIDPFFDEY